MSSAPWPWTRFGWRVKYIHTHTHTLTHKGTDKGITEKQQIDTLYENTQHRKGHQLLPTFKKGNLERCTVRLQVWLLTIFPSAPLFWFSARLLYILIALFLGAFAKLWKATISFVMSACPSVRMEQLGSRWTDFHKIWYLCIFRQSVEKLYASFKSDKK
jgi:hypothetical protein